MNRKFFTQLLMFAEIGITDYKHLLIRVIDSPLPLEYNSGLDAEGDVNTDNSHVTLATPSPVRPEEPVVKSACGCAEPAEDCLGEARTLVPIEEFGEVADSESEVAPEENKEPLPIHEQLPAYSPVCGQHVMHGGRINAPYTFRCHCFPYTATSDPRYSPTYS